MILNTDELKPRLQELISILNGRARKIVRDLAPYYEFVEARDYLDRFQELHRAHVEALDKGNIAHAHEILCSIHELSYELERHEFWRHAARTQPQKYVQYCLREDAFTRGPMICAYVVGEMQAYSPRYPSSMIHSMIDRLPAGHPSAYKRILGESPPEPNSEEVMAAVLSMPAERLTAIRQRRGKATPQDNEADGQ